MTRAPAPDNRHRPRRGGVPGKGALAWGVVTVLAIGGCGSGGGTAATSPPAGPASETSSSAAGPVSESSSSAPGPASETSSSAAGPASEGPGSAAAGQSSESSSSAVSGSASESSSSAASGSASENAPSGPAVTLTYGTTGGDDQLAAEQKVLDAFQKVNPSITVKLDSTPFDAYDTKLTTALRAGNGPDVFRVNHPNVQAWTNAQFLAPLDNAGVDTSAFITGLVDIGKVNGKQYALPLDTDARVLYFNPAILAKAGITAPPATWDELLTALPKIKATGAYGYSYRSSGDYDMAYETVGPYMNTAGGAILADNSGRASGAAAGNAGTVKAVEFLQQVVKSGATPPGQANMTEDTMVKLFAQGKLAFMVGGPWERPTILKDNPKAKYGTDFKTAPVPVETAGGKSASTSGGWQIGIAAKSKNLDAATKLLTFIEQPANLISIAAVGSFPPLKTGLDSEPWKSDPFYDAYKTVLPNSGLPILPVPQLAQVAAAFEKNVAPVLLSGSSAKEALTAFDTQVNEQILR